MLKKQKTGINSILDCACQKNRKKSMVIVLLCHQQATMSTSNSCKREGTNGEGYHH